VSRMLRVAGAGILRARARPPRVPGKMNQTEKRYAAHLQMLVRAGECTSWLYESVRFKLSDRCYLTPDFYVRAGDQLQIHEVKGHREDDAMAKFRIAAGMYPEYLWLMVEEIRRGSGRFRTILTL
jgi:hypothetical protein